jgi:hypothetical protein
MPQITYYVVQPFIRDEEGDLVAGKATEAPASNAAKYRAQAASTAGNHVGAIAFSRTGDPKLGDFDNAVVLGRYGETPEDMAFLD